MVAKNVKRLGVGATASAKSTNDAIAEADWTKTGKKKILSVGKRQDEEDDVLEQHDSSSDDEEGRTSAVKERKRKVPGAANDVNTTNAAGAPKNKKKRKGKKERHADSDAPKAEPPRVESNASDEVGSAKDPNKANAYEEVELKKPKRKKSRSKQKNIRKDKRSESDRPSYLNVRSAGYAGRPLTKATKEKLGLGSKHLKDNDPDSSITHNKVIGSINSADNEQKQEDSIELSKIGDCVVGEIVAPKEVGSEKMKKRPKRTFKNF